MRRACCDSCGRPEPVCYCHLLRPVHNHWPVVILQHVLEARHPLNTARIAALSLSSCTLISCADTNNDQQLTASVLASGTSPVLIYPSATSQPITNIILTSNNSLLFIDASWRKSRRLYLQSPWLQSLPAYQLAPTHTSRYLIRKEPRPEYLSTLEAIVQVLEAIDDPGKQHNAHSMLEIMDWMIAQQCAAAGHTTD